MYCALVGVTKDWLSQNASYNCENYANLMLRQANQYNVPMPTTYITKSHF